MTTCTICGQITATAPAADGLLHCCARCTPQPTPCDPGPHVWHGSARPGTWICWACGETLSLETVNGAQGASTPDASMD
jgi:hypothetical protein